MPSPKDKMSEVVQILNAVKTHIDSLLTEDEFQHHKIKLTSDLQRNIEYIALITGTGDVTSQPVSRLEPATTIAGEPIRFVGKAKAFDVEPEEQAVTDLKGRVDMIYPSFVDMDSKDLRKNVDDIVIRGVARKAKMKGITKDSPAIIDIAFIDEVKLAITTIAQHEAENDELQKQQGHKVTITKSNEVTGDGTGEVLSEWVEPDQQIENALGEEPAATSEDAPDSVEEIEQLKDAQEAEAKQEAKPKTSKKK